MIDPSFTDVTDAEVATVSPYLPYTSNEEGLQHEIAKLKNDLELAQSQRSNYAAMYSKLHSKVEELEEYIKDNFSYIDEDVAQRIVEIFDLEITQEYDVQVTVTFTGTVKAPLNFDMDTLEDQLDPSLSVSFYADGLEGDFMEDRVEVEWSEN